MRRFRLNRKEDESGVSGTGFVAEGVELGNKMCVLSWLTRHTSVAIYPCVEEMMTVHGHGGKTVLEWIDP